MIIENQEEARNKANKISDELLTRICKDAADFGSTDDPAEKIYFLAHLTGQIVAKVCISLEEYGKIYGIENFSSESIHEWIKVITKEIIKLNKK